MVQRASKVGLNITGYTKIDSDAVSNALLIIKYPPKSNYQTVSEIQHNSNQVSVKSPFRPLEFNPQRVTLSRLFPGSQENIPQYWTRNLEYMYTYVCLISWFIFPLYL